MEQPALPNQEYTLYVLKEKFCCDRMIKIAVITKTVISNVEF